jgi:hypothetical protein
MKDEDLCIEWYWSIAKKLDRAMSLGLTLSNHQTLWRNLSKTIKAMSREIFRDRNVEAIETIQLLYRTIYNHLPQMYWQANFWKNVEKLS